MLYYPATLTLNAESMRTKLKYRGGGRNRPMWWAGNDHCSTCHIYSACTVRAEDFVQVHYTVYFCPMLTMSSKPETKSRPTIHSEEKCAFLVLHCVVKVY
jgi:hypothetical protein